MLPSIWRSVPTLMRIGLAIVGVGLTADIVHHVFAPDLHVHGVMPIEMFGHVLTLVGMVVALLGIVSVARSSRRRASRKGGTDAARIGAAASR